MNVNTGEVKYFKSEEEIEKAGKDWVALPPRFASMNRKQRRKAKEMAMKKTRALNKLKAKKEN